jgi:hypothetical protein
METFYKVKAQIIKLASAFLVFIMIARYEKIKKFYYHLFRNVYL